LDGLLGGGINPITLLAFGAFAAHQALIGLGIHLTWADSYLDPLCTVPVILGLPSAFARRYRADFALHWGSVIGFTAVLSWTFEAWIPGFDARFTADPLDAVAYFVGAGIWRFVEPQGN
jgi:hypothetical protein